MNVDAILISEFATLTDNDRALTILRCFNGLAVAGLPGIVSSMAVSFVVHAHFNERGTHHQFELKLLNQRREEVKTEPGSFTLPAGGEEPQGVPLRHSHVVRFVNVVFQEAGPYAFELYIDGTYHAGAAFLLTLQQHGER